MLFRKNIHYLDNDSLLQVFSCYRLEEEDNWYLQLTWRRLVQVCQRWRYLIYNSSSHLDLCLLLTNDSPSIHTPSHLPLLPLIIYHSDGSRIMARKDEDNIHLGLQQNGRVRRVVLQAPSLSLSMWLESLDKGFPRLEVLSLVSTTVEQTNLMLPETLQAPDLRHLALHGIGLPRGLQLLSSSITLLTISLTHIGVSCYFPPGILVIQLQGLPHLEELSIGFNIPIPLPSSERELLLAPIPPVTLPTLKRLTFRGVDVYLDNLVAQINTPLLERLDLTLFFDLTFTLVNLTEFIHRTKGLESPVALLIFNKDGASINTDYERGNEKLSLHVNCGPLLWQIDSATQVCSALGKVLSIVEDLTVDLDKDGILTGWENTLDSIMWHELLLPFIGVKKLHIGTSLTLELSQAPGLVAGQLVLELLPKLQELELQLEIERARDALSLFVETRKSVGHPVDVWTRRIRRPTQEELINAKRWVDEKKRMAFNSAPDVNGVASWAPIPESEIQEYHRNVERLDQILANIEKYIYFAFAVLKKEDIIERMFTMMVSVKFQMEELRKPVPRYMLELQTIRGMIQEAYNIDKGLKAVLQRTQAQVMAPGGVPSAPRPPPQSASAAALFAQSPAAPPAPRPTFTVSPQKETIPSTGGNIYPDAATNHDLSQPR